MKNFKYIAVLFIIISCKQSEKSNSTNSEIEPNSNSQRSFLTNLIQHPYIFEEEGFQIEKFTSEEKNKGDKILLELTVSGEINNLKQDHRVFVHGADNNNPKELLINVVLDKTRIDKGKLIFYREFTPNYFSVETLRFGITNYKKKNRLFTLTMKDIVF